MKDMKEILTEELQEDEAELHDDKESLKDIWSDIEDMLVKYEEQDKRANKIFEACKENLEQLENKDLKYELQKSLKQASEAGLDLPDPEKIKQTVKGINLALEKGFNKKDLWSILSKNFGDKSGGLPLQAMILLKVNFPKEKMGNEKTAFYTDSAVQKQKLPSPPETPTPGTPVQKLKNDGKNPLKRLSENLSKKLSRG